MGESLDSYAMEDSDDDDKVAIGSRRSEIAKLEDVLRELEEGHSHNASNIELVKGVLCAGLVGAG